MSREEICRSVRNRTRMSDAVPVAEKILLAEKRTSVDGTGLRGCAKACCHSRFAQREERSGCTFHDGASEMDLDRQKFEIVRAARRRGFLAS